MNTTQYSRGTASYRAPEVIAREPKFNNKVDIWALGCILYEMATCIKLFADDYAVLQYSSTKTLEFPLRWPSRQSFALNKAVLSEVFSELNGLLTQMLELEPSARPKSQNLVLEFLPYLFDGHFEMQEPWEAIEIANFFQCIEQLQPDWNKVAATIATKNAQQVQSSTNSTKWIGRRVLRPKCDENQRNNFDGSSILCSLWQSSCSFQNH